MSTALSTGTDTPAREPIGRRLLSDELTGRLRTLITEGELGPGEKLTEAALCQRFAVSRTPLREAMRALAAEGLVQARPGRGVVVTALTLADLEEAFPVIGALEALAGELAAERASAAEVAHGAELSARLARQFEARDLTGYFATNEAIHALIREAAGNPTLTGQIEALEGRVRRARCMANLSNARWAEAVAEHAAIQEALETRDGPRLAGELKRHLANKFASLKERLLDAGL